MATTASINPDILAWARRRTGMSLESLSQAMKVPEERLAHWESGKTGPTFAQARTLAAKLHIPFAYFYLSAPPEEDLPIPDLRTLGDRIPERFSPEFRDLISDVLYKYDWYREERIREGFEALPFIASFANSRTHPDAVAGDIRDKFGVESLRATARNPDDYLTRLVRRAEDLGIWVLRSGIVGNNTHRPLAVEEFRGFAIADHVLPLVFLNARDARAAQIFSLMHEVAHLWIGRSGVSNPALTQRGDASAQNVEAVCNAIAAEVLVPHESLLNAWDKGLDIAANARGLTSRYRVSSVVIARRVYDLGLVDYEAFVAFFQEETAKWRKLSGKGDFNRSSAARFGRDFRHAVVMKAMSGDLLWREAAALLNVKPKTLKTMYRNIQDG